MKHLWLHCSALALLVAGCSGSGGSTAATSDEYDDVAQALSSVVSTGDHDGEAGSFYDATQISVGTPPLGLAVNASGHLEGKHAALAYDYSATCRDAAGRTLSKCDLSTDAATVMVSWSGELASPNLSATITHQGALQLHNIQSGTASISGDGGFDFDTHFQSVWRHIERDYHLGYTVSYDAVRVRRVPLLIVGGAIHYAVTADHITAAGSGQSAGSFRMEADIAFAVDGSAALTLDGTHHYRIDMASGLVSKSN